MENNVIDNNNLAFQVITGLKSSDSATFRTSNNGSTGYHLLIQLANNLFSYSGEVNLASMITPFDAEFYQFLLNAKEIRRKGYPACH